MNTREQIDEQIRNLPRKSHTLAELLARKPGEKIFRLETCNDGENDLLIGESIDEIIRDLAHHHDWDTHELPSGWTLVEILMDEEHELEPYR